MKYVVWYRWIGYPDGYWSSLNWSTTKTVMDKTLDDWKIVHKELSVRVEMVKK